MAPLALVALLFSASPQTMEKAATSAEAAQKAAADVLANAKYQRELPVGKPVGKPWRPPDISLASLGTVLSLVVRMAAVVLVALLVIWLVRLARRHVRDPVEPELDLAGTRSITGVPLAEAEALAVQGRFAEAVHVLLLRTLEVLSQHLSGRLPPAFTSREVLAEIPLRESDREALAGLVSAVELCHFGGADATESDYQICLGYFRRFATAYEAGA